MLGLNVASEVVKHSQGSDQQTKNTDIYLYCRHRPKHKHRTQTLSKKSPIPEKRRITNFKEMRGGEDRELSGRSNFLIDSAREKGGGGNFLMNLIRNSKEKGGGRTQSSGEQFPYCFS